MLQRQFPFAFGGIKHGESDLVERLMFNVLLWVRTPKRSDRQVIEAQEIHHNDTPNPPSSTNRRHRTAQQHFHPGTGAPKGAHWLVAARVVRPCLVRHSPKDERIRQRPALGPRLRLR